MSSAAGADCIGLHRPAAGSGTSAVGLLHGHRTGHSDQGSTASVAAHTVLSLGERSICLQMTAQSLVACLRKRILRSAIDERQLLDAVGQLLPQVTSSASRSKRYCCPIGL